MGKSRVYPRVCGGTKGFPACGEVIKGLSPRVRGNLDHYPHHGRRNRSIPACAGEPEPARADLCKPPVYPRVCGGTAVKGPGSVRPQGLSPRVRGNHDQSVTDLRQEGSIPACAGEPSWRLAPTDYSGVYPRVCGGTHNGVVLQTRGWGLSPRVRGNPARGRRPGRRLRSIPACAGEPLPRRTRRCQPQVYPRVCGGT